MSLPIRLTDDAEADFNEAFDWYEAGTPPAGPRFEAAVRGVYRRLSANPRMHAQVYGEVRRAVVKKYPYVVLYVPTRPRWSSSPSTTPAATRPSGRAGFLRRNV